MDFDLRNCGTCDAEGNPFRVGRFNLDASPKFRSGARDVVPMSTDQKEFDPRVPHDSRIVGTHMSMYREDLDKKFIGQPTGRLGSI